MLKKQTKMKFLIKNTLLLPIYLALTISTTSCKSFKKDDSEEKVKKNIPISVDERTSKARDEGGFIFGGKKTDPLDGQNPLWRASLEALENLPLESASYNGGIINTDWYSKKGSNESIKITVMIKSTELKANSIKISSFKRTCDNSGLSCSTKALGNDFNGKIKDAIIQKAKQIEIKKVKKK